MKCARSYLYGHVVAVPADHVERGVVVVGRPQVAAELLHDLHRGDAVLVRRGRRQEVTFVREAVRADRAAFGQRERRAVVLADVAARARTWEVDPEPDAARHHGDLTGRDLERPELGADQQRPALRDEEQLPVGVDEVTVGHRAVRRVPVDADAAVGRDVAVATHGVQAVDEVGGGVGDRQRIPAQPVRARLDRRGTVRCAASRCRCGRTPDAPPRHDAVDPGAAVDRAGLGERGAADLLGVQPERARAAGVAPDRHGARGPPR